MSDKIPNRYNAARDANDAARRAARFNPRRRATDSGAPVARFIFRALLLATWGAVVYNVASGALA